MLLNLMELRKHPGKITRYRFEENFPPLRVAGEKLAFLEPVIVEVRVEHTGTALLVRGLITSRLDLFCNRCLSRIDYPLRVELALSFIYQGDLEEAGIVLDSEQEQETENYEIFTEKPVNLRAYVLEMILLNIPMRLVCHPDCKGLCLQCGINLNEEECTCEPEDFDPRLAELKKLLKPKN